MWNKEENALIKSPNAYLGYWVIHKEGRSITLFDDLQEAREVITRLLDEGAEVFENDEAFYRKYPPLSIEDRKRLTEEFLRNASRKKK